MRDIKDLYRAFGQPSKDDGMKSIANIIFDMANKDQKKEGRLHCVKLECDDYRLKGF